MRLLLLLALCTWLTGCAEKETLTLELAENDSITGSIDGRSFAYGSNTSYGSSTGYWSRPSPTGETAGDPRDPTPSSGGLTVTRVDASASRAATLELLGYPIHEYALPARSLTGTLSFAAIADDSTPGCPHIDSTTMRVLPVQMEITSWENGQLVGNFVSTDTRQIVEGAFRILILRP